MRANKTPEGWQEVELGNVCEVKKGSSITKTKITEGNIPVIAGGQQPAYYHSIANRMGETITVSGSGAYAGFVAYYNEPIFASDCSTIRASSKEILLRYAFYFLKGKQRTIYELQRGIAQPHVYPNDLAKIKIPLPPLETQKKIVSILEKAERLKKKRGEADKLTQEYLKSVFYEMFGDPIRNEKGWQVKRLEELSIKTQIGPFGTQLHEEDYIENGIPLINPRHINDGRIEIDLKQTIAKEKYEPLSNYHLKKGDVIMGRRGEMGRCALITSKEDGWLCGTGSLFIRPNENLNSYYLIFVLRSSSFVRKLENDALGVTMMNLNMTTVNNLIIPFPPLPLQQKFASIVKEIESMKEQQKHSKEQIDELFNVLMQKAFSGGL